MTAVGWLIFQAANRPYLWNLRAIDTSQPGTALDVQQRTVTDVVFSKDSKWLVLITDNRMPFLLHLAETSAPEATIPLLFHTNVINDFQVSNDNRWFATGSEDNYVRIWNLRTLKKEAPQESRLDIIRESDANGNITEVGHARPVTAVAFDEWDSKTTWLSSGDRDGIVYLWNLKSDSSPQAFPVRISDLAGEVRDLRFAYNNGAKWLTAVTRENGQDMAHLWNMNTEHLLDMACAIQKPSAQEIEEIAPDLDFSLPLCEDN